VNEKPNALLVTVEEASRMLCCSPRTLWGMTQRGEIPRVRIGRSVRYDPADLRRWIEAQKAGQCAAVESA
jgi:excisionase family DNA binding protein